MSLTIKKSPQIIICSVLLLLTNNTSPLAKEFLTIQGGNDEAIELAFDKIIGSDLETLNISYEIKQHIKLQLEETTIFKFSDESKEVQKTLSFFKKFIESHFLTPKIFGKLSIILRPYDEDEIVARIKLYDTTEKTYTIDQEIKFKKSQWYLGSNIISDLIYEHFTGLKGYLNSTLVFISESGTPYRRTKKVAMMDLYGHNLQYLTDGTNLVLTPRFSPDKKKIIYLSYASGYPTLYLLNLSNMKSRKLLNFKGMVYAPRFSQDGQKIILTASYQGNSEIIIYDLKTKKISRITHHYAIDTTPSFSPNSNKIVFSSDRTGSQQLYIANNNGKNLQKINFTKGSYATPVWSPDGKYIAFTKMYKGKFHIGIVNVLTRESKILTESYKDESPSWAPNSKLIMFTRKQPAINKLKTKLSQLHLVNLNGEIIKKINTPHDASDADWVAIH